MGKVKFTAAVAEIRNKVGGSIYSRNRYGAYVKNYAVPTNPSSGLQQLFRQSFIDLSFEWSTLTPAQRLSWENFSQTVKRKDIFGQQYARSAQGMFMSLNMEVYTFAGNIFYDPPGLTPMPLIKSVGIALDVSMTEFNVYVDSSGTTNDDIIIVKTSPPLSQGIFQFKGRVSTLVSFSGNQLPLLEFYTPYFDVYGTPASGTRIGVCVYMISYACGVRTPDFYGYVDVP